MLKRWKAFLAVAVISGGISVAVTPTARAFGPLSTLGSYGQGAGQMSSANGVAVGPSGSLYLADSGNGHIDVYSGAGAYTHSIGRKPVPTGGGDCDDRDDENCGGDSGLGAAGVLSAPRDVAVDSAGNLFVADYGNSRISVFTPAGAFIRAFGVGVNPAGGNVCTEASGCERGDIGSTPGTLSFPTGVAIDAAGLLYVAGANRRIDVFSAAGAYVRSIGKEIIPSGEDQECRDAGTCPSEKEAEAAGAMNVPSDVAVDADGQVAVSDPRNFRVGVFTSTGSFVRAFGVGVNPAGGNVCTAATGCKKGVESTAPGGLRSPGAIALGIAGTLLVADTRNHRINEFAFDGSFVRAFGEGVASGAAAFQVCTTAIGCRAGLSSANLGSVSNPRGLAVDCHGTLYVVESSTSGDRDDGDEGGTRSERIERLGEPGAEAPPCRPPADAEDASPGPLPAPGLSSAIARTRAAKPIIEVELNAGSGTATLVAIVSDPGALLLKGKGIRKVRKKAPRPGLYELPVVPTGAASRSLLRTGKAKVKLLLTFRPKGDVASTQSKAITLKRLVRF